MSELEKLEGEVKAEAVKVENKVEAEVTKVETEVKTEVKAVEAEAKKVEDKAVAEVKKFATAVRIDISDAEKYAVSRMENMFLKGQTELRRLQDEAKAIQEAFPKMIDGLFEKYVVDKATHIFNVFEMAFIKK